MLEEHLNRTSTPAFYCDSKSDWKVIWLSLTAAARPDCLLSDLEVFYNQTTGRWVSEPLRLLLASGVQPTSTCTWLLCLLQVCHACQAESLPV